MFALDELLMRLHEEFGYHAAAKGLILHTVKCRKSLYTDPRLLEQMIRNLLSNAIKYTEKGSILLGCRCRPGTISIEVWDTGIGIADKDISEIFNEYYQLNGADYPRD